MNYDSLRAECFEANMELPRLGLVLYNFGNVSCIDRQAGVFAIKPSGIVYEALAPKDIV
ncbi:MAG: class II aldolase/adducin family protein, partial [Victivallales bacterium]|nr:class II aldolase/adducin family protein [Victivallales bacterium]